MGEILRNRGRVLMLFLFAVLVVCGMTPSRKRQKRLRKVDTRVYLKHADELKYDQFGPNPDAQIAKGHVHFINRGATLLCDSAYYYQATNSFRAFGHVRFRQGDTLSLTCDNAWYDGEGQMMQARKNVVLHHRGQVLYTDSLNYDRLYENAYFFKGGRLVDGKSKLSSDWGEYNTNTRQAVFYFDVQLHTPKNRVSTDTLYYDTKKSIAHIVGMYTPNRGQGRPGPSIIHNQGGVVKTTDAFFNTKTDRARLYGRSTVVDKEKTITGDTLFYNSTTGRNHGYGNVVFVDTKNKNKLTAGEVAYNEKTGKGFATKKALVVDFSQKDTLYMHADTLRLETFNINTDSVYRRVHGYDHVRAYRADFQAMCDSLVYDTRDSCLTMYKDPITWSDGRQLTGEKILIFTNDSTVKLAHVIGQALSIEQMKDSVHYRQVSSKEIFAYFNGGNIRRSDAVGNVRAIFYPTDKGDTTLIGLNYVESDTMRMFVSPTRQLERIWMPKAQGTLYPMTQIPPGKDKLDVFQWFADLRPTGPDDVFVWRGKPSGSSLRIVERHAPPLQKLPGGEAKSPMPKEAVDSKPMAEKTPTNKVQK